MGGTVSSFEVGLAELPPVCDSTPTPPAAAGAQSGIVDIPLGANQVALTFTPPYLNAPYPPTGSVLKPSPTADDIFFVGVSSLVGGGCIAFFSAPTQIVGYQFSFNVVPRS